MPYKLLKTAKGIFLIDSKTGKKYSNKPMTEKQLLALRVNSKDQISFKGGDFMNQFRFGDETHPQLPMTDASGEGFFGDMFKKVKDVASNVVGRVSGVFTGRGDNYPPAERAILEKYGNSPIVSLCLYREKVASGVNKLANVISLGQFNKVKNDYGIDQLYHLMLVVSVNYNDQIVPILVEKNEVINLHEYPNIKPEAEKQDLSLPANFNHTFGQLLENGQKFMGSKWFSYDAFTNNCQDFLQAIILSNPPLQKENPTAINFIKQDTSGLTRDLSGTTKNLFSGITTLANRLNVLAKGKGFDPNNIDHHYDGSD
jgi:hypothetical protein